MEANHKRNRYEIIIEISTWIALILIIFGVRFLPVKLLNNDSVYLLIGIIAAVALFYYLIIYKYFAKSTRFYIKNIADIILIGVLIHLLKDYGEYFFALYFLPIAAAALSLEFINALLIATVASMFVIFEIFLNSQQLLPQQGDFYYQGVWQIGLILFITIFCRMLAIQLKQEKVAKEEAQAREKALREESERQKEFLSLTSHQLFTPLSMIRGFVSMLDDHTLGTLNPKQKEAVTEIHASSKRMVDLVSSLLSISRIQAGSFTLDKKEIDLPTMITELVKNFSQTLSNGKNKIVFEKPEKILPITADPDKIRQVLMNLLDNALKYCKEGQITVSCLQSNDWTTVRVSDQGVGINPSDFEKLFQPFFRGKNILELDNTGTGLGLYISRLIVEKHGGHITAENNSDRGATFEFTLPMK